MQEAFIRFWRSRDRVADPAAYFYACVKHVALDWRRNRERQSRREEAAARSEAATFFAGPARTERTSHGHRGRSPRASRKPARGSRDEDLGRPVVPTNRHGADDLGQHSQVPISLRTCQIGRAVGGGTDPMNNANDDLESELAALRPHDATPGLRRRIADHQARSRSPSFRWRLGSRPRERLGCGLCGGGHPAGRRRPGRRTEAKRRPY